MGLAPAARELRLWGTRWLLPRRQAALRSGSAVRRAPVIEGELPRLVVGEAEHRAKA